MGEFDGTFIAPDGKRYATGDPDAPTVDDAQPRSVKAAGTPVAGAVPIGGEDGEVTWDGSAFTKTDGTTSEIEDGYISLNSTDGTYFDVQPANVATNRDLKFNTTGTGPVVRSAPSGLPFRLVVDDEGVVTAEPVV